jgi:hypothetical protein
MIDKNVWDVKFLRSYLELFLREQPRKSPRKSSRQEMGGKNGQIKTEVLFFVRLLLY